jgi:hypothetical protein
LTNNVAKTGENQQQQATLLPANGAARSPSSVIGANGNINSLSANTQNDVGSSNLNGNKAEGNSFLDVEDIAEKDAAGAGSAYDIASGKEADENNEYNIGTDEQPIMNPGSHINNIKTDVNACIKNKTNNNDEELSGQEIQDTCVDTAVATCQGEGGYCSHMKAAMVDGDNDIDENVVSATNEVSADEVETLSTKVDVSQFSCIDIFKANTGDNKFQNIVFEEGSQRKDFLNDILKIGGPENGETDVSYNVPMD